MQPLRHGYTNDTRGDGSVVVKRYQGPDSTARSQREYAVLQRLRGRLPVPPVLGVDQDGGLRMGFVDGVQGQELIEAGHAALVMRACGAVLREIHALPVADFLPGGPHPAGAVLVHGDFGPNNVLFDRASFAVTAVLDWEWVHPGDFPEDLAWCEWIVRMHHPEWIDALEGLFHAYGRRPSWTARQDAMLARCRWLVELTGRWDPGGEGVRLWRHRLRLTAGWRESSRTSDGRTARR